MTAVFDADVDALVDLIEASSRLVVMTGAGVSTAAGIPDFRGPNGVWTKDPASERLFDYATYLDEPDVREEVWRRRAEHPAWSAAPTDAHVALAGLFHAGRLDWVITQNIDGLHQAAGIPRERVVEVHGTLHEVECVACKARTPMPDVLQRVTAGDSDPRCVSCGGIQKSATISFGQSLDPQVMQQAHNAAVNADLFLVCGSSLVVHPVALLPRTALNVGARLAIINQGDTPYDALATFRSDADVGVLLKAATLRLGVA
jgi:NAD-dependent deacetylase